MAPGHAEDPLHLSNPEERSHLNEQSTLLASGQIHSPLAEEEEDEEHARQVSSWKTLPWWKRPSPYWLICGLPFSSIAYSALQAPKVAMYTALACHVHRPEIITNDLSPHHSSAATNVAGIPISGVFDGSVIVVEDTAFTLLPDSAYTTSSSYSPIGPAPDPKCASDPVIQATVARLNAVLVTTMGILSCLTTAWWGSLSDRYGRRTVIFVSAFGLFLNDFVHVVTGLFVDVLPGGYWFPLVGYSFDGLCGSMSTALAMNHAYLTDTSDSSSRSQYFSLALGVTFAGVAIGPVLGGLLIRWTETILPVFYFACILRGVYIIFVLFFLPESLTRARVRGARLRRKEELPNEAPSGRALRALKSITKFLSPLVVLLPQQSLDSRPLKRRRSDWSLLCIAMAYGLYTSTLGSFSYKFQYATAQFNWTPEITSYYVGFMGATRAVFLTVILPLIIRFNKPTPVQLPCTPDELVRDAAGQSPTCGASSLPGPVETEASEQRLSASRSPAFDLALTRVSAGMEFSSYVGMAVAGTGVVYTLASTISSFGAGFIPAAHAIALDIYTNRGSSNQGEVGKLFGAFSVMEALGAQIISPALYGLVYYNMVAILPQAIIVVSMCISLLTFTLLLFVRVSSKPSSDHGIPGHGTEERRQGTETPEIFGALEEQG